MEHQSTPRRFVALYEGNTVCEARIIAAGTDPELVAYVERSLVKLSVKPNVAAFRRIGLRKRRAKENNR